MKITSVNNDLVKETAKLLRGKYRDESGLFLIEGEKGVAEALQAGIDIRQLFVLEGFGNYTHKNLMIKSYKTKLITFYNKLMTLKISNPI